MDVPVVILLGPPACGKGTQARFLTTTFGWRAFSTGTAIRSHVQRGTVFGRRFQAMLGSAYLLPDEEIDLLIQAELEDHTGGLVLDGFPRTLPQAEMFDAHCARMGWSLQSVVFFDAKEEDLKDRILHRLSCPDCGGTYRLGHDQGDIPAPTTPCPACHGALVRRKDDRPEVFAERFEEYHRLTLPLVDLYAARGILHTLDALSPPASLANQLRSHFENPP